MINSGMMLYSFYDWLLGIPDGLSAGQGMWGSIHITLICVLCAWLITAVFLFSRYKRLSRVVCKALCIFMLCSRLFRMALLVIAGRMTFFEAMPWHLCHIMALVLPIFYLCGNRKFIYPLLAFAFFGGVLTFLFGNYYVYNVLSFLDIESILLHFMLPTVAICCLVDGYYEVKLTDTWKMFAFIIPLACYAEVGNTLIAGSNFMYIRQNGLPFNFFGSASHILTYLVLMVVLLPLFTLCSWAISKGLKKLNRDKNNLRESDLTKAIDVVLEQNEENASDTKANIE